MSVSRQKGTAFETAVVGVLRDAGLPAERRALNGRLDRGDIAGVPGWTLECKNEKTMSLAGYVDEARQESSNAGTDRYAAVVKRRGKGASEAYVVMPLAVFVKFVLSASRG